MNDRLPTQPTTFTHAEVAARAQVSVSGHRAFAGHSVADTLNDRDARGTLRGPDGTQVPLSSLLRAAQRHTH